MGITFKAKTDFPGGIYINGTFIGERWQEFTSSSLFAACSTNSEIKINVFKDGKYAKIKEPLKKEKIPVETKEDFINRATVAELKTYLIDHGHTKKEINNLSKKNLIKLVLEG